MMRALHEVMVGVFPRLQAEREERERDGSLRRFQDFYVVGSGGPGNGPTGVGQPGGQAGTGADLNPQMYTLTKPAPGNHEYLTAGAWPYVYYFGAKAGFPGQGYYSYDRGSWHIVALNSNCEKVGGCGKRSPQGRWLRRDLADNPARCTLAYFHHPLYASGTGGDAPEVKPFWTMLYDRGADVILSAHVHRYERFALITPGACVRRTASVSSSSGRAAHRARYNTARTTPTWRSRSAARPGF